jgi:hypothetical protein
MELQPATVDRDPETVFSAAEKRVFSTAEKMTIESGFVVSWA